MVGGGQKGSLIFFHFKYVNNYVMTSLRRTKKFVNNFFMGLICGFEVGGGVAPFFKIH